ncbi:uncharacterized protein MELLADRAFT_71604 [Melampsora larici-populina 98AG31]|uniref:Uncharacterized protein n=1 Tax=Melampsora larici-populina (strain 98AG31 / pathotype 3-4-7) TaxID=747676 RepID=F4RIC4_MELLP|nr:uncharacterized protein MELLADRAFT_71604 [Melampsora larici-populina 98AG31]EGG07983.1 hypothetical protein MELLADRAFT_71604 [Melampsora larici-populina 98AG31]
MSNDKGSLRMIPRSDSFLIESSRSSSPHHFLFQSPHHHLIRKPSSNSLPSSPTKPVSFPSTKPNSSFIQLDLIKRPSSSRSFKRAFNSSPTAIPSLSSLSRPRLPSSSRSSALARKRLTPNSNHRHRPTLPPRLSTSSTTTSPLTVPCGIIAKGKMTLESDRDGSPSEALSRALRAVSRNRSSSLDRSWSRSQTDQSSSPSKEILASTYPSPSSVTEDSEDQDSEGGFPFNHCTPNDLNHNHSSSYITFASLNVHAPPSPPQSANGDDLSFDSISNLESLPKNWWTK